MTTATSRPPADSAQERELASIVPAVPGIPWWGAVAVAVVLTVIGAIIGGSSFADGLPLALWILYLAGSLLAVAAVRRRAVFTAMVQPPLVGTIVVFLYAKVFAASGTLTSLLNLVKIFPMVAVGTAVCVLIGVVRLFAQPLRDRTAHRPADAAATL